jgi:flagellar biosynthesis regulator FlaF
VRGVHGASPPSAARNNYQENLSELKSYLNLIEAEKNLRTKGLSILSIHPKENLDLVTKIQSLRYNKQTLNAFIERIQDQLPRFTPNPKPGNYVSYQPSILKERPTMFLEAMKSTPIETFKKILLDNFPDPDEQTSGEIREAILSLAISQLKAGLISYKVALDYFLPEIDFLFDRKNMVGLSGKLSKSIFLKVSIGVDFIASKNIVGLSFRILG